MLTVRWVLKDGTSREVAGQVGASLMAVAKTAGCDIEAACEGSLACATCHVALDEDWYRRLGPPSEDEESMLDALAFVTPTSRLSCQIRLTEAMNGLTFRIVD